MNKLKFPCSGLTEAGIFYDDGIHSPEGKGLQFSYNVLNLPETVTKSDGSCSLTYTYLTISPSGSVAQDQWYVRNHLGNVRSVIDLKETTVAAAVKEQSDYLPFGTRVDMTAQGSGASDNRWRYAGKEEQRFGSGLLGIDLAKIDFGARFYDPYTARWTTIDPLASKYSSVSPYTYCANDPVNKFDPDGKSPSILVGTITGASLEYGTQVLSNILSGDSIGQAITEIDGKSILIAAGAGAAGVGLATKAKQFASLGKTMKAVLTVSEESVLGAAQSAIDQIVTEESVSWKEVAADAALSGIGTSAGIKVKTLSQSSQEYKQAKRALDHAERIARGTNPRQSRLDKVTAAQEKLDNVGERQSNIVKNSSILVGSSLKELGISYTKRIEDEK